jgi:hypothetical protein
MKILTITMVLLFMLSFSFAQSSRHSDAYNLFGTTRTILQGTGGYKYFVLTDADTATSVEDVLANGRDGSIRISVMCDTTSGSTKVYVDVGLKIGEFGSAARNIAWHTGVDSLEASDDGTAITIELSDFTWNDDPPSGFYYRLRQTGTQVNRIAFSRYIWYPLK